MSRGGDLVYGGGDHVTAGIIAALLPDHEADHLTDGMRAATRQTDRQRGYRGQPNQTNALDDTEHLS
jgi:hypothetical protein